jgi:hypothetical protein
MITASAEGLATRRRSSESPDFSVSLLASLSAPYDVMALQNAARMGVLIPKNLRQ